MLDAERSVVVTGEELHQDVLCELAPERGRSRRVAIELVPIGPRLEARLDGQRVGELTALMSQRYGPTVDGVLRRGGRPGCIGRVVQSKRGVGVELRLPAVGAVGLATERLPVIESADGAPPAEYRTAGMRPTGDGCSADDRPPDDARSAENLPAVDMRPAASRLADDAGQAKLPALPPWSRKPLWVGVGVVGLLGVIGGVLGAAKASPSTADLVQATGTPAATSSAGSVAPPILDATPQNVTAPTTARSARRSAVPTRRPAAPTSKPAVYYASCEAAQAAGSAPLRTGDPGYRAALDTDGDGVACEPD